MRIGIIGAGNIGGNLTRRLTALGHDVAVANSRGPQTLGDLVAATGARAVPVDQAAKGAELVIVSIPLKNIPALSAGLLDSAAPDAVIVDTSNYYPRQRDGRIADIEDGKTESRWVSDHLNRPVVKVFNGIYSEHLLTDGRPAGAHDRRALPVAGDDSAAKATVIALLDELGFDGVDAGSIDESWRQQPGTPAYGASADAAGIRRLLVEAPAERPADFRA